MEYVYFYSSQHYTEILAGSVFAFICASIVINFIPDRLLSQGTEAEPARTPDWSVEIFLGKWFAGQALAAVCLAVVVFAIPDWPIAGAVVFLSIPLFSICASLYGPGRWWWRLLGMMVAVLFLVAQLVVWTPIALAIHGLPPQD